DSARLLSMLEIEIFVAPALESAVDVVAERREGRMARPMKMDRVVGETVIGREIHSAAEPPSIVVSLRSRRMRDERADVHVHRGDIRIAGMQDARHADGLPRAV